MWLIIIELLLKSCCVSQLYPSDYNQINTNQLLITRFLNMNTSKYGPEVQLLLISMLILTLLTVLKYINTITKWSNIFSWNRVVLMKLFLYIKNTFSHHTNIAIVSIGTIIYLETRNTVLLVMSTTNHIESITFFTNHFDIHLEWDV